MCVGFFTGNEISLTEGVMEMEILNLSKWFQKQFSAEVVSLDDTRKQFPFDIPGVPKKVYET